VKGPDGKAVWKHAIGEIAAFLNGVHTVEGLHKFGCWFWDKWGVPDVCARNNLPTGDLGRFYGRVWTDFDGVNQIDRLMRRLRQERYAKHHRVTNWHPAEVETEELGHTMPCRPCHGDWQVVIYQVDGADVMDLIMVQRSGDLPIGVPFNTFQYAVLLMVLAQIFGCRAGRLIHVITHCHIYQSQVPSMVELLGRAPVAFPEVELNYQFSDVRDLRVEHVELVKGTYNPHPPLEHKLPVLL
jgi:thymidylate synthase